MPLRIGFNVAGFPVEVTLGASVRSLVAARRLSNLAYVHFGEILDGEAGAALRRRVRVRLGKDDTMDRRALFAVRRPARGAVVTARRVLLPVSVARKLALRVLPDGPRAPRELGHAELLSRSGKVVAV